MISFCGRHFSLLTIAQCAGLLCIVSSSCRFAHSEFAQTFNNACNLVDATIILAFVVVAGWVLVILACLLTLARSPLHASTIFTIENPSSFRTLSRIRSGNYTKPFSNAITPAPISKITNISAPILKEMPASLPTIQDTSVISKPTDLCIADEIDYRCPSYASSQLRNSYPSILEAIPLDLPTIQVGMSQLDVSFMFYDDRNSFSSTKP
ncbi:uncharacterized protein BYT42DRAFT_575357 [Radiomyces spectabilis]|uniref:uncharacterized protein n=1 Tax=Radiomyces spectabilis TaxID=64574 RepID=UPI00222076B4|nr:uncharacterized protein BYT42DRAFT_575357 [Radiomyces spectabilis]KAI8374180.1 hypothetical protein BYT42DRAFT_575357 [Radiomyces spectabilis]